VEIELEGITIGALQLRFYSIMILLGLAGGILLAQRHARRLGEDPEHVVNIAVLGVALALVGARLYHVFDQNEWPFYRDNPDQIIAIWNGGIGIFGAITGSLLALFLYVRWKGLNVGRWLDIAAPSFLLGQAIGRWGNFFNEELFGSPSDLPWAIPISADRVRAEAPEYFDFANSVALEDRFHPLFLYESFLSFLGVAVMVYIFAKFGPRMVQAAGVRRVEWNPGWRLRTGDIVLIYFLWYPTERFFLEFLRNGNWVQAGVPMAQWFGGAMVLAALLVFVWRHRQPAQEWAATGEDPTRRSRSAARRQRRRAG
jgi:phosphatidylglycerol:prolipoprotein diacylglycerol transferase